MTPQAIINRASRLLNDIDSVRWTAPELLDYVADGQLTMVRLRPSITAFTSTFQIQPRTRQDLPPGYYQMLRIHRSMGPGGNTPGSPIVLTSRASMDAMDSEWHFRQGDEVQHWIYDPDSDRGVYWVYPAPSQPIWLEATLSRLPPAETPINDELMLGNQWLPALLDYVLFRCFDKDADYGGNAMRAQKHEAGMYRALELKYQATTVNDPNLRRRGGETRGQV